MIPATRASAATPLRELAASPTTEATRRATHTTARTGNDLWRSRTEATWYMGTAMKDSGTQPWPNEVTTATTTTAVASERAMKGARRRRAMDTPSAKARNTTNGTWEPVPGGPDDAA